MQTITLHSPRAPLYAAEAPRNPTHTADGTPIVATARRLVPAGIPFSFTGQALCCLALEPETDALIKRRFNGGTGKAWHVYVPNGSLSYCDSNQTVYVAAGKKM